MKSNNLIRRFLRATIVIFAITSCGPVHSYYDASYDIPSIPLDAGNSDHCGIDMRYPASLSTAEFWCIPHQDSDMATFEILYRYKHRVELNIYWVPFLSLLQDDGSEAPAKIGMDAEVFIKDPLQHILCDGASMRVREMVRTPIRGVNWNGWIFEQSFSAPYSDSPETGDTEGCEVYSSDHRCVWVAIGNDSMSAMTPLQCFVKERRNDLDQSVKFDVFMDMLKTVRFHLGGE